MTLEEIGLIATIVLVGVLAGNETGTLTVIHPSLDSIPYAAARPAAKAIIARFARVMPVLMPLAIAVTIITAFALDGSGMVMLLIAAALLVVMLVTTFVGLMPLNTNQLGAGEDTPEATWRGWRESWLRFHTLRVICDLGALVLVAVTAVTR